MESIFISHCSAASTHAGYLLAESTRSVNRAELIGEEEKNKVWLL
jgi:hypothetical protein